MYCILSTVLHIQNNLLDKEIANLQYVDKCIIHIASAFSIVYSLWNIILNIVATGTFSILTVISVK